ncbi:hypothetical protein KY290_010976 [Solanum tuberosum]|uniref:Integrase core domain containing protein n=1 Tax=Solanum tuberosum TaxID=4113 RepID=A0ABQ7VZD8_SOLTU|nr:hypothetical protein KY290_010976 [Solanum tuberosum]
MELGTKEMQRLETLVSLLNAHLNIEKREEEWNYDKAHMKTQIVILTKHIIAGPEKGVSKIITRETRVIILEIKVGTISEMVSMTDLEAESKETNKTKRDTKIVQ